ncbi:hypothetical protein GF314_03740 [bacterium]|nr:hypothetical protein [bacterium]
MRTTLAIVTAIAILGLVDASPADTTDARQELRGAWRDFEQGLTGLARVKLWSGFEASDVPVFENSGWIDAVSSGGAHWSHPGSVVRYREAELDGTTMVLTLRYGVSRNELSDEDGRCWTAACELRLSLDLPAVVDLQPQGRQRPRGWLEIILDGPHATVAERGFVVGDRFECRSARELTEFGWWEDYGEPRTYRRLPPCFIPAELRGEFERLVAAAKLMADLDPPPPDDAP